MSTIDVFTTITYNTSEHAELLHKSLEKFKTGNYDINYKAVESKGYDYWPKQWKRIEKTGDYYSTSVSHAVAIHSAMRYAKSDYIMFIDTDICMLKPNWDYIIIKILDKRDMFGCGFAKEGDKYYHYYKFPSPHLFCFKRELLDKVRLNFMPLPLDNNGHINAIRIKIRTDEESQLFNRKIGERIKCDTGWLLPKIFSDAGLTTKTLDMIYNNSSKTILPWYDYEIQHYTNKRYYKYMSEWHYKNKLFATHKKDTTRGTLLTDNIAQIWKRRIDMYTQKEYGFVL